MMAQKHLQTSPLLYPRASHASPIRRSLATQLHIQSPQQKLTDFTSKSNAQYTIVVEPQRLRLSSTSVLDEEMLCDLSSSFVTDSYNSTFLVSGTTLLTESNTEADTFFVETETPELPISESSDTLDIPFASLFDLLELRDATKNCPFARSDIAADCVSGFGKYQTTKSPNILGSPEADICSSIGDTSIRQRQNMRSLSLYSFVTPKITFNSIQTPYQHNFGLKKPLIIYVPSGNGDNVLSYKKANVSLENKANVPSENKANVPSEDIANQAVPMSNSFESHVIKTNSNYISYSEASYTDSESQDEYRDNKQKTNTIPKTSKEEREVTPRILKSASTLSSFSVNSQAGFLQCSTSLDINKKHPEQSKISSVNEVKNESLASVNVSWSYYELPKDSQSTISQMTLNQIYNIPCRNDSWSYYNLPDTSHNNISFSTLNNGHETKSKCFITTRNRLLKGSRSKLVNDENKRSSKRKRQRNCAVNAYSFQHETTRRQARQRLLFTSPSTTGQNDYPNADSIDSFCDTPQTDGTTCKGLCSKKNKYMRDTLQDKENYTMSPTQVSRSHRKPLLELGNVRLNNNYVYGTYTDSFTAPENCLISLSRDCKMPRKTSADSLPSREEELRSRDTYYSDFTVDRQHKIDDFVSRTKQTSGNGEGLKDLYTLQDSSTNETLLREVEGAENSLTSFAVQGPLLYPRATRVSTRVNVQRLRSKRNNASVRTRHTNMPSVLDNKRKLSRARTRNRKRDSVAGYNSHSPPTSTNRSGHSSRPSSHKTCTTHPIASSTLIIDSSPGYVARETNYPQNLEKECNLEKTCLQGTNIRNIYEINHKKFKRQNVLVDTNNTRRLTKNIHDTKAFEISKMVSQIDELMNHRRCIFMEEYTNSREDTSFSFSRSRSELDLTSSRPNTDMSSYSNQFITSTQSSLKPVNSSYDSKICLDRSSDCANKQDSACLNNAKVSIICTSSEGSSIPEQDLLLYKPLQSKKLPVYEPGMCCLNYREHEEGMCSVIYDNLDIPQELERLNIFEKPLVVSDCFIPAARCRPRTAIRALEKALPSKSSPQSEQALLDSILTDSPKSVNPSGIFAPDNSYTIPTYSNNYDQGNSDITSGSPSHNQAKPRSEQDATFIHEQTLSVKPSLAFFLSASTDVKNVGTSTSASDSGYENDSERGLGQPQTTDLNDIIISQQSCLNVAPKTLIPPQTKGTHNKINDPSDNKSPSDVPSEVILCPPKIKNKISLVKKLRKFGRNFYKKTGKVH